MANLTKTHHRWFNRFRASLSLKLIGIFVGGSMLLATAIGAFSQFGIERHLFSTVRPIINHYVHFLNQEIGTPPNLQRAQRLSDRWPLTIRVFDHRRNIRWSSDGILRPPRIKQNHSSARPQAKRKIFWDHGTVFVRQASGNADVFYGIRLRPKGPAWVPLIFISLVLLTLVAFYILTRRLFAPIKDIELGIIKIGEGQLTHRLTIDRHDELGTLSDQVNQMAEKLQTLLRSKRDLLLMLSHELKSPLARSRVSLALMEDSALKTNLLDDQIQMQQLIDEIIDAEKAQGDFAVLQRQPTDIKALIERVCSGFDNHQDIEINFNLETLTIPIDSLQIERLAHNLLENALRYNDETQGIVKIDCSVEAQNLQLIVSDFGPGISQQHIKLVTQAFYRVDPSRDRNTGGTGLGLYLCQAIVNAHQGSLTIHSQINTGTKIHCQIPLD